ncbi:MAG: hypothetical protein WBO36_06580 [Saprospiraceae bacterium]
MDFGLKRIENRFGCEVDKNLISEVYLFLLNESSTLHAGEGSYLDKEEEAQILLSYIKQQNLYYHGLQFSVFLDEGAEQKVFFDEENKKVIKLNDAIFYVNWTQYFESIIVHNILFKETQYELLGFMVVNELIYSVVSQDYIAPTAKTEVNDIKELLLKKGFSIKKNNDYIHTDLGLIIEDLHEENVLVRKGQLFFIDTVIYLK